MIIVLITIRNRFAREVRFAVVDMSPRHLAYVTAFWIPALRGNDAISATAAGSASG
jgi:hypothetical protein